MQVCCTLISGRRHREYGYCVFFGEGRDTNHQNTADMTLPSDTAVEVEGLLSPLKSLFPVPVFHLSL